MRRAGHSLSNAFFNCADSSGSAVNSETELEEIVNLLRDGTIESRSLAAERLFNKAAEDETARQRTASLNVVQPLVSTKTLLLLSFLLLLFLLCNPTTSETTPQLVRVASNCKALTCNRRTIRKNTSTSFWFLYFRLVFKSGDMPAIDNPDRILPIL